MRQFAQKYWPFGLGIMIGDVAVKMITGKYLIPNNGFGMLITLVIAFATTYGVLSDPRSRR